MVLCFFKYSYFKQENQNYLSLQIKEIYPHNNFCFNSFMNNYDIFSNTVQYCKFLQAQLNFMSKCTQKPHYIGIENKFLRL